MNAVLEEDGSVIFYDNNSTEVAYIIEAPYMFDSAENYSDDIEVKLEKTDSGYNYTIIPNAAWLKSKDTIYPVTIDPTLELPYTAANTKDTTGVQNLSVQATYGESLKSDYESIKVGRKYGSEMYGLIYATIPSSIPSNARITNAYMRLKYIERATQNLQINAYQITSDWNTSDIKENKTIPLTQLI